MKWEGADFIGAIKMCFLHDLVDAAYDSGYNAAIEDAKKEMCKLCSDGNVPENRGFAWVHDIPGIGFGPCYAAPIWSRGQLKKEGE